MPNTQSDMFEAFFNDSAECIEIAEELISNLELIITNLSVSQIERCDAKLELSCEYSASNLVSHSGNKEITLICLHQT